MVIGLPDGPTSRPNTSQGLDLALERFGRAVETREPRDILLDSYIGLEALLLGGIREEKAFQLSARAAHLIGDSPARRRSLADLLRKGYDLRSALVHGGVPKKEVKIDGAKTDIGTVALRVREVLREVARRILLQSLLQDPVSLSKILDARILGLDDSHRERQGGEGRLPE